MKTVIVLGMHRSATSMVARSIHESKEVHMGNTLLNTKHFNPKGHYENTKFVRLNEDILYKAGGNWRKPPPETDILNLFDNFKNRIQNLINEESSNAHKLGYDSWGWKDPRTCLTIKLFMPFLQNPQFIVTYRNPIEIANSLNKRDGISIENGVELTKEYNKRIFDFITNI